MMKRRSTLTGEDLFSAASEALESGNERLAFNLFSQSMKSGYVGAEQNLAYCYDEGVGVRKNFRKARYWYKTAWRHGFVGSASNLATMYATRGNRRQAVYWWRKAITRGDGDAAVDLAKFYLGSSHHASLGKVRKLTRTALKSKHISPAGREEARALAARVGIPGRYS